MERPHVIIVGAGAAGLVAASEIAQKCNVTILETREFIGGRIRTTQGAGNDTLIEAGAEFVHGDTPVTSRLLKEAGLKTVKLNGKMLRKEGKEWTEEKDMIEGWDELVEKMKGQRNDMTMQDFLQKNFPGDKYASLRRHVGAFVQGFDVAGVDEVSVQSLYREWSNEGDQMRITTGYTSLINYLYEKCEKAGCLLLTGKTVKQVDWQKNEVTIYTSDGEKFSANKSIITVPVSVLRDISGKAAINLTPPADDHIKAACNIGFGTVVKVILDLKQNLWENGTGFIFSTETIPTWWTQYPLKNNLITGWVGGPAAARLSQHTDDELLEIGVISLSNIFDVTPSFLRNIMASSYVFNWSKNEESLGAYSFSTPESAAARKILNEPLAGTVFFAGEALYDGPFSGTVEAALSNGNATAAKVLKSLH
ncbi:MAG: FAD-dependent oxidoreductase [Chitinophagaceae bacterium]|nr:FAD-dependent oxidoreductase [Chitinophagaceae bacterium]